MGLLPTCVRISRQVGMKASPEKIYPYLSEPLLISKWNPFTAADPRAVTTYSGPASGVGASWAWSGGRSGAGTATITSVEVGRRVVLRLDFLKPFKATNVGEYSVSADGTVQWFIDETAFVPRLMSRFVNLDKLIGREFEKGLAMLKAIVEG